MGLGVKNLLPNVGDVRDTGSITGLGRSPGAANGYPLQYFSHLMQKINSFEKTLIQGKIEGRRRRG